MDVAPWLSDEIVADIARDGDLIYNKNDKENPLIFKCYNEFKPSENNIIYCYNYENTDYKYRDKGYNLYFCCNKPMVLFRTAPFTLNQCNILLDNTGYSLD